ncbi:MAG: polysaccharide deacetylase family protein [Pirellulales bacterium]|nr:polysaccharide deacetylase family protein [Pirellulales bacterium]
MPKPLASLSLDLDNRWSYMKTHGDEGWESHPSYLDVVVPRVLEMLRARELSITFFVVGQDAVLPENQPVLRSIAAAGHELGNHSFHHEPWLHLYTPEQVAEELRSAEEAILAATGERPVGFRGPGFSFSDDVLRTLVARGYVYDASTFPTFLGPLARLYYFLTARLSHDQQQERKELFGKFREGFRPLRPYLWSGPGKGLVEIPVTTMPVFKLPIHASYILYLARFSRLAARAYFSFALGLCRAFRVQPSILLHPLDFLGRDDGVGLEFFPAMDRDSAWKCELMAWIIDRLAAQYSIVTMREHAAAVLGMKQLKAAGESRPDSGAACIVGVHADD